MTLHALRPRGATLRILAARTVALGLLAATTSAIAQEWPTRPVRFIAPFPPGGSVDQVARVLANYLAPGLGQQVVVDNRGGAAGSIGTAQAAKAAPDGYTFVVVFDTHGVNPSLIPNMPFDTQKDLAPVMLVGQSAMAVTVHSSSPINSFGELVAAAKAKPESIGYGTIGAGSLGHLAMVLLQGQGAFRMTHVPYKGGGPLMQDAVAGHVPVAIGTTFLVSPHVQSRSIRPIAVTSAKRAPQFPDVPTLAEQGFRTFEAYAWWGVLAPAATLPAIVNRMNAELVKALAIPAARERLAQQGMDIVASSPEAFGRFVAGEIERWGKVVRDNGIKAGE